MPRRVRLGPQQDLFPVSLPTTGIGASAGTYSGLARVVDTLAGLSSLCEGEVLVVRASSPAWTIGMLRSGAIVTELGGPICHAAIIARELGIPAVVAAEKITSLISTGDRVVVDGTSGIVSLETSHKHPAHDHA